MSAAYRKRRGGTFVNAAIVVRWAQCGSPQIGSCAMDVIYNNIDADKNTTRPVTLIDTRITPHLEAVYLLALVS